MENKRQKSELSDIFRDCREDFLRNHKLCEVQHKAFNSIINCRTAQLGGHSMTCPDCGHTSNSYNSCRNRNCPKCQFIRQTQWVDKLAANIPPVKQFHIVFTIPNGLNALFLQNQSRAYSLLFKAAGKSVMQCARNNKYLGAQAGAIALLHTWGQNLSYHPHLHMIVPAGGLSDDGSEWIPSGRNFFLPVKLLSAVFRGLLFAMLKSECENGTIKLPDAIKDLEALKNICYEKNWVVYCEKPFTNATNLIRYLGNYTHRVAISNHRIAEYQERKVKFSYKDYKSGGQKRVLTLDVEEFVRRFMQHVLPSGFCKIRYFGFLALSNMKTKLEDCRQTIGKTTYLSQLDGLQALEVLEIVTGKNPFICPICKQGRLIPSGNIIAKEKQHG